MKLPHTFRTEFSYDGKFWTADVLADISDVSGKGKTPRRAFKNALRMYKSVLRSAKKNARREVREGIARLNGNGGVPEVRT